MVRSFLSKKNKSGFTLLETIVAIGIGILATIMLLHIFTFGLKAIRTIKNTENLHSNANFLLNKLTYLIKQGKSFDVLPASPGDRLVITFPDNSTTSIDKSDFQTDNIVATTTFRAMQKSIQINFIMQVKNTSSTFSATTTIAQRGI